MESTPSPDTEPTGLKPEQLSALWRRHLERVLRRAERQRKRGRAARPAAPKPERSDAWTPSTTSTVPAATTTSTTAAPVVTSPAVVASSGAAATPVAADPRFAG